MEAAKAVPVLCTLSSGTDKGAVESAVCVSWLSLPWDVLECFKRSQELGTARWIEMPERPYLLRSVWQAVKSPVPGLR